METSGWVAVRCLFGSVRDGQRAYEERVTLWRAVTLDEGLARGEEEAHGYAADLSTPPGPMTEYLGLAQAYLLADEPSDGAEVFSLIRVSELDGGSYLRAFFDTGAECQVLSEEA